MSKIKESKHMIEVREEDNISKIQEVFKAEAMVEAEAEAEAGAEAEAEVYEV